jgi:hypothetical protein
VLDGALEGFARAPGDGPSRRTIAVIAAVTLVVLGLDLALLTDKATACLELMSLPLGLLMLNYVWPRWRALRRLRSAALLPTPIPRARGGRVGIRGRVLPSTQGLIAAPSDGRGVVWARIEVSSEGVEGPTTKLTLTASRDFWIDDGTGERAYIVARDIKVEVLERRRIARNVGAVDALLRRHLSEPPPQPIARTFWRSRQPLSDVDESVLSPGDEVVVFGPSRRELRAPEPGGGPSLQLVVAAGKVSTDELLVGQPSMACAGSSHWILFTLFSLVTVLIGVHPLIEACVRLVLQGRFFG